MFSQNCSQKKNRSIKRRLVADISVKFNEKQMEYIHTQGHVNVPSVPHSVGWTLDSHFGLVALMASHDHFQYPTLSELTSS